MADRSSDLPDFLSVVRRPRRVPSKNFPIWSVLHCVFYCASRNFSTLPKINGRSFVGLAGFFICCSAATPCSVEKFSDLERFTLCFLLCLQKLLHFAKDKWQIVRRTCRIFYLLFGGHAVFRRKIFRSGAFYIVFFIVPPETSPLCQR